jgi:hypothetical protein
MNIKTENLALETKKIKDSLKSVLSVKALVLCCTESLYYFNRNLLTPAEFLNSLSITLRPFRMKTTEDFSVSPVSQVDAKFIDLEEFDNYNKKYFKLNLLKSVIENSPPDELLEELENVS